MPRYDKYDSEDGGFRASLAANLTLTNGSVGPVGVGLDVNGRVVVGGGGHTPIVGVLVKNMPGQAPVGGAFVTQITAPGAMAGDVVDVMTDGEIVDLVGFTAGTVYYADPTTGVISSTPSTIPVGWTVEATRLVVRMKNIAEASEVTGGQTAPAALTNSTGGAADNVIDAIPDATAAVTDTSAASLASTNAALAAIGDDLASLTVKVNAILTVLGTSGLTV